MIDALRRDLTHAVRSLRRTPAFTTTAVVILGLAIGMASAMFAVFRGVALEKLPVTAPDRLVTLSGMGKGGAAKEFPLLIAQYRRFRDQTNTLSAVAGYAHWGAYAFPITDGDRPLILKQSSVTANFFQVLGARPLLGRVFGPDDERDWGIRDSKSADYYIVLSYSAWRRVFGGDSGVVGHRLLTPVSKWNPVIIGVAPPGLDFPRGVDYWVPAPYGGGLDLVGRLAPNSTAEAAKLDYFRFIDADPEYARLGPHTLQAQVHPLVEVVVGDIKPALVVLIAAVGLLLLLACVNIGNLMLLRAATRVRELAIRRALGAGSGVLVGELLAEGAVLSLLGGVLGVGLARLLLTALIRLAPADLPRIDVVRDAGTPFLVAALVTILTLLLFALVPAIGTLRFDLSSPLRVDVRAGSEGRRLRVVRQVLVASQIGLALLVLAGAGLLVKSFAHLAGLDFGYPTEHLSIVNVAPPYDSYMQACGGGPPVSDSVATARVGRCVDQHMFGLHDRIEAGLASLPDVVSASTIVVQPFLGPSVFMTKVVADHQTETEGANNPFVAFDAVGPEFFHTFGFPLIRGRAFSAADRMDAPRVAIVSEDVARMLWPAKDALGRRFHSPGFAAPESLVTVVGIVRDVHYREHRRTTPTIYFPYRQVMAQGEFIVRTKDPLSTALPGITTTMRDIDPSLLITRAQTMDELIAPELSQPRLEALLLAVFALAAVVLAAVGVYGIMASAVSQQTRELGVRMALGATPNGLRKMVLGQALTVAGAGAAVGLVGALAGSRLLASMLFEVSPSDPVTLIGVSVLLLSVALLAAYLPARRATKVDPARALRAE